MNKLALERVDLEGRVQRAEGNRGGEQEHSAKHDEHDPERTGHHVAKVQGGEHDSDDHADNTIHIRHIAFHGNLLDCWFYAMSPVYRLVPQLYVTKSHSHLAPKIS